MTDHQKLREAINRDGLPQTVTEMRALLDATMPKSIGSCGGPQTAVVEFHPLQKLRLLGERYLDTLPKTKMVEVWHVEYVTNGLPAIGLYKSYPDAERWAVGAAGLAYIACIRVTGPHQQMVPDEQG